MSFWLSLLALTMLAAATAQIVLGLRPMESLRKKVEEIKSGQAARLDGRYPSEVQPLVDEVNSLLDSQDETVRQARSRAGDLAHGLNTPITILSAVSREVRKAGLNKASDSINEQITAMDQHVQRELNRARLASQLVVSSDLTHVLGRVVETMRKIPADRTIDWKVDVPDRLEVPLDSQDLSEVLGNVLDNARKWTASTVSIGARTEAGTVVLTVEDDGPGVRPCQYAQLTRRGRRLDEATAGTGLGLAIADDIMTAYDGTIEFYQAAPGGLGIRLTWPIRRR